MLADREAELEAAAELLTAVAAGDGAVLAVTGAAGTGKTTLVAEIARAAGRQGFRVLRSRGAELETSLSFGVVQRLLARAAREDGVLGEAPEAARRLLDPRAAGAPESGDPFGVLNGVFWVCAALADRGPLLLAVDDTHWADEASLRALAFVRERLEGLPVLVLVARRPPAGADALLDDPRTVRLQVGPLSEAASAAVVRQLAPGATAEQVSAAHRATGGLPFYLVAVAQELASGHGLVTPDTVVRAVQARVRGAGEAAATVAQAAAILGRDAELRHVSALTGLPADEVALAADALERAHVLTGDRPLEFVHAIVRDAVVAEAPAGRQAIEHRRAARVLEQAGADPLRVAVQLLLTEPSGDAAVVDALLAGARHGYGPETGLALLERALAEPPSPAQRPVVLTELGLAKRHLFRPDGRDDLVEALSLADDPRRRAELLLDLALLDHTSGRPPELIGDIERVLAELDAAHADPEQRGSLAAFAVMLRSIGLLPLELATLEALEQRLATLDPASLAARTVASTLALGRWFTASATGPQVAEIATGLGERIEPELVGRVTALQSALPTLTYAGRPDMTVRLVDSGEAARSTGSPWIAGSVAVWRMPALHALGRLAEAEAEGVIALEYLAATPVVNAGASGLLALVLLDRHGAGEAATLLARTDELPHVFQSAWSLQARARVALARGDWRAARRWAQAQRELVAGAALDSEPGGIASWRRELALALHRGGEEDAEHFAQEHLERARRSGTRWLEADAELVLAEVGDPAVREARIRSALAKAETGDRPLLHAAALAALGRHLRRAESPVAAREPLRGALEILDRCGAGGLRGDVHDELRATGLRPLLPRELRRHQLTVSELRTARLAADRMTNREIAQTLFVTTKTVEAHLRAAFRKLGVNSRGDLAAALEAQAEGS